MQMFAPILAANDGEIVQNGGFEKPVSTAGQIEDWEWRTHEEPEGGIELSGSEARGGSQSLFLRNATGPKEFHYEMLRQLVAGLDPGREYVLSFWGKGEISGQTNAFGVCEDDSGVENFCYATDLGSSEEWKEYTVQFKPNSSGEKYVVFISRDFIEGYYIDDVRVEPLH